MSSITVQGSLVFGTKGAAKKAFKALEKAEAPFATLAENDIVFAGTHPAEIRHWGAWVMAGQLAAGTAGDGRVRISSPDLACDLDLVPGGWLQRVLVHLPELATCRIGKLSFRHDGGLRVVAAHPERGWVATASEGSRHFKHEGFKHDGKGGFWGRSDVVVWDVETGELVAEFLGRADGIVDMAFSGDRLLVGAQGSKRFPTAAARNAVLCAFVFDLADGSSHFFAGDSERGALCWCGPERFAVAGRTTVSVCTARAEEVFELHGHAKTVMGVAWCDATQRLFSLDSDGAVVGWDLSTGREVVRTKLEARYLSGLAIWTVGGRVALMVSARDPILLDPVDLSPIDGVELPDSVTEAHRLGDDNVYLRRGNEWTLGDQTFGDLGPLGSAAVDDQRGLLFQASSHYRRLMLRDVRTGEGAFDEPHAHIDGLCMTGDLAGLFEWQGAHWLYTLPDAQKLKRIPFRFAHDGRALPSPCGRFVVRSTKDFMERVDLETGETLQLCEGNGFPFAISSDGAFVYAAYEKKLVRFSLEDAQRKVLGLEGKYGPRAEGWGRLLDDRRLLVVWRGIHVWDLEADAPLLTRPEADQAFVDDTVLSVWTRGRPSKLEMFDAGTLALRETHEGPRGRSLDAMLSPTLGVDCANGVARVLQLPEGEVRFVLHGHLSGAVPGCAVSTDNRWFGTIGGEGTVVVYERAKLVDHAASGVGDSAPG